VSTATYAIAAPNCRQGQVYNGKSKHWEYPSGTAQAPANGALVAYFGLSTIGQQKAGN
jgi:hypothetical protein